MACADMILLNKVAPSGPRADRKDQGLARRALPLLPAHRSHPMYSGRLIVVRTVSFCSKPAAWPSRWASLRPSRIIPATRATASDEDFNQGPASQKSWARRAADENVVVQIP